MKKLKADRRFGRNGMNIPPIIYGSSYLGNLYTELSYDSKLALIKKWFECTEQPLVIDSAGKYGAGLALEIIGRGLADLGVDKEKVIISNKLGWYRVALEAPEPTFEPGAWVNLEHDAVQTFGYNEIIACYEQGNELLGGTYSTQLVSVHDPDEYLLASADSAERQKRKEQILESYRALFDLKKLGKVRAVGIGSKDWRIIQELYELVKFDWVMLANSFTIYHHPKDLLGFIDLLYADDVGIVNSAVFHGGFLTGGSKFNYKDVDEATEEGRKLFRWRMKFNSVCNDFNIQPGDACIHFGISHPGIAGIALNTSKPEKMLKNVEILQQEFSQDFWDTLKSEGLIDENYVFMSKKI